mmetsp:Transcript_5691/g.8354  ORF Transcript_5691/g.8354 Transcript_5691/m.8354 type:complete len:123 (-) Transcript_5691:1506-1874(-)
MYLVGLGLDYLLDLLPIMQLCPQIELPRSQNGYHLTKLRLGVAYLTGVHAFKLGSVKEGSSVLVIGASGGCGLAGIQLAVAMKANVVGICSGKTLTLFRERAALIRWRILIWNWLITRMTRQ